MQIPFTRPMRMAIMAIVGLSTVLGGVGLARRAWGPANAQEQPAAMYSYSATPEAAVDAFLTAVNAGNYGQAARYYWTAPERWQNDPLFWKQGIERATGAKQFQRFEHLTKYDKRQEDAMFLTGYLWYENEAGPRQVLFDLVKKPEGWIIVSFR